MQVILARVILISLPILLHPAMSSTEEYKFSRGGSLLAVTHPDGRLSVWSAPMPQPPVTPVRPLLSTLRGLHVPGLGS